MKIKKFFLVMLVALTGVMLISCVEPEVDPIEYDITFYDKDYQILPYQVGDLDVDPAKVYCVQIKFDRQMNENYAGFWTPWSVQGDIYSENYYGFVSSTTYRVWPYLRYDTSYSVTLNPDDSDSKAELSDLYFRDKKGNFLDEVIIDFTTTKSKISHPHTFEIDLGNFKGIPIKFYESEYDAEGNLVEEGDHSGIFNAGLHIMNMLDHENVKKGDTLKINYKVWVDKAANNIQAQIADPSHDAGYWTKLANTGKGDKDPVFIDTLAATTDEDNPVYKSGTLTYNITDDTKAGLLTLQFYYTLADAVDKDKPVVTLNFVEND